MLKIEYLKNHFIINNCIDRNSNIKTHLCLLVFKINNFIRMPILSYHNYLLTGFFLIKKYIKRTSE
jgi:hypothetical protein